MTCPNCGFSEAVPIPPEGFHLLSERQKNIVRILLEARGAMISTAEMIERTGLRGQNSLSTTICDARKRLPSLRYHIYSRQWSGYGWLA